MIALPSVNYPLIDSLSTEVLDLIFNQLTISDTIDGKNDVHAFLRVCHKCRNLALYNSNCLRKISIRLENEDNVYVDLETKAILESAYLQLEERLSLFRDDALMDLSVHFTGMSDFGYSEIEVLLRSQIERLRSYSEDGNLNFFLKVITRLSSRTV
jgi:hypothetical protein